MATPEAPRGFPGGASGVAMPRDELRRRSAVRGPTRVVAFSSDPGVKGVRSRLFHWDSEERINMIRLKQIVHSLKRVAADESGGEVIEYALVLGLIIVVAIAIITAVGGKVLARWQSVNSSM